MKILKQTYLLAAIALISISCEDDALVTLNPEAEIAPTLSDDAVVLTKELEGTDVLTITWPEPDFGFTASPTYVIYLDKSDGNFSEAISISNGTSRTKTFKAEELNKHLINLGFEPEQPSTLKIKVAAVLSQYKSIPSSEFTVDVTAYSAFLDLATTWGVVGSGYNNWGQFPDAPFFLTSTPNVLVAYVKLLDGQIKFREDNDWTSNFGDTGADGTLEEGGSDITVTAGYKKITFNPVAKTYTIEPFTWGIVGSAYNDWGNDGPDFPFTYDDATDQWRALVKLQEGAFKIRKNNTWGGDYGDNGADGTLEEGGSDISVAAGKYQITFNEKDLTITIESIPNIWGLVGSAYNDWGADGPDAQFEKVWRDENKWILKNVTLLDGQFKIRDANDWGTNYGDTGADNSLEPGGSDITVVAGVYTITLDFTNPDSPTISTVKY